MAFRFADFVGLVSKMRYQQREGHPVQARRLEDDVDRAIREFMGLPNWGQPLSSITKKRMK